METNIIAKVNGVEISAIKEENEIYIPINPICEALGIDAKNQKERIGRHNILHRAASIQRGVGGR